jgi:hypothetical protein
MKIAFGLIRLVLTGVLIYLSYLETGIYTAICFILIFIALELTGLSHGALVNSNNKIVESTSNAIRTFENTLKTINRLNTIDKS